MILCGELVSLFIFRCLFSFSGIPQWSCFLLCLWVKLFLNQSLLFSYCAIFDLLNVQIIKTSSVGVPGMNCWCDALLDHCMLHNVLLSITWLCILIPFLFFSMWPDLEAYDEFTCSGSYPHILSIILLFSYPCGKKVIARRILRKTLIAYVVHPDRIVEWLLEHYLDF